MNFAILVICFSINIIISIGLPIGVLVYIIVKRREYLKSYLIGALIFFLSQVVLRLPILNFLSVNADWYIMLSSIYPILYSIILGLSAGIFEEVGRFWGFKVGLKKNRTYKDGLAFGVGHGGIEAILITGISSISNLIAVISLHNGSFNSINYGMTAEEAIVVYGSLRGLEVLTGGFERLFAMCIHIGMTIMILYGINKSKKRYLLFAIIIHGIVDAMLGILQYFGIGIIGIELWVMMCAIVSVVYTIKCKGKFEKYNYSVKL